MPTSQSKHLKPFALNNDTSKVVVYQDILTEKLKREPSKDETSQRGENPSLMHIGKYIIM